MEVSRSCPICSNTTTSLFFKVKDHSISKENFIICKCHSCQLLFTADAPGQFEIGKYYASESYISHTDSKKGLLENLYQVVRKQTLAGKRKLIKKWFEAEQGTILDYGCGTGAFLHEMKVHGWDVQGIEPDAGARGKAELLNKISIGLPDTISDLPDASFDVITMWHVLEHVHDIQNVIRNLKRLLKPNGKLIIAVPNHSSYDAIYYNSFWAAYDVPRHLYHFTPDTLKRLMTMHELKVVAYKGMWFDAFYVAMLSEKYKNGTINFLKAFLIGLLSNGRAFFNIEKCSSLIYIVTK